MAERTLDLRSSRGRLPAPAVVVRHRALPGRRATIETEADRAISAIVDAVCRSRLAAGNSLPSERQVGEHLQISRPVVREAFRALNAIGLISIRNGRRPSVGEMTGRSLTWIGQQGLATGAVSLRQMLDVLSSIDRCVASLAAMNRTSEDVAVLTQCLAALRAESRLGSRPWRRADARFHRALAKAAGNPMFDLLSTALRESLARVVPASSPFERATIQESRRMVSTHASVLRAVIARRPDEAGRFVCRCLERTSLSACPTGDRAHRQARAANSRAR